MDPLSPDEAFDAWPTNELTHLYRARMRVLLTLEVDKAPLVLTYRQERLVAQARRLCRRRGVENPSMR